MLKNAKLVGVNVNSEEYHKVLPGNERGKPGFIMSSTPLRSFAVCPSKWVTPIVAEDGTISYYDRAGTASTKWGNLFDCFVLTPQQFDERYVLQPDTYDTEVNACPKCGSVSDAKSCRKCGLEREPKTVTEPWNNKKDECQEWRAEREKDGQIVITKTELFNVKQSAKRFLEYPGIKDFIDGCFKQVHITAEWHDPDTGLVVPTQCLIDLLPNPDSEQAIVDPLILKCVADLKTTMNAAPLAWRSWAHKAGYEIQAGWNIAHVIAATQNNPRDITSFAFLLSENYAPWQPGKRMMTYDPIEKKGDVDAGIRQFTKMMQLYCKCLKTGKWVGYDDHDEAASGWTIVQPDPYKEMNEQFAPRFVFDEEERKEEQSESEDRPDFIL